MPTADDFDGVFSAAAGDAELREVMRAGLRDLPDWVESFNFVPASGLVEIAQALGVGEGAVVVDLACGLGGPGLLIAGHTGARLVGVDWSQVGCRRALEIARARSGAAHYVAASGAALPLATASVDAAFCVDALRFIPDYGQPELRRVLRPSARLVITAWERDGEGPLGAAVPSWAGVLADAGFRIVADEQRPEWLDLQREVYEAAIQRAPTAGPAVVGLAEEGERVLPFLSAMRRVLVVAEAPQPRGANRAL